MFDFGSGELLVIGVVALVVIGPKELPGLLRTVGQAVAKMRRIAGDFQGQFQDALREADLHDAVKSISDIQSSVSSSISNATGFNDPLANLTSSEPSTPPALPAELNSPIMKAASLTPEPGAQSAPASEPIVTPKNKTSKKKKADKLSAADDPQAALFDTLETMAKKDRSSAKTKDAAKAKPKAKSKPATKSTASSSPARKTKPKSKKATS